MPTRCRTGPDLAGDDNRSLLGRVIDAVEIAGAIGGRNASPRTDRTRAPRLPVVAVGGSDTPDTTKRTAATAAPTTTKPLYVARVCDRTAGTTTKP